jgi:hypothetical protein
VSTTTRPKKIKPAPATSTPGRRRFKSKFTCDQPPFDAERQPRPFGDAVPVIIIRNPQFPNRPALLKFYKPSAKNLPINYMVPAGLPWTFRQVADWVLGQNQRVSNDAALMGKLDQLELDNAHCHEWNRQELSPEILQEAVSGHARFAFFNKCVQRSIARLYAVAWFGRADDSIAAKMQLEKLIPTGRDNPITKWIPKLEPIFLEMRCWICESNWLMKKEFPREIDRRKKLAELYGYEDTGVIDKALNFTDRNFLAAVMHAVLGIPENTVIAILQKQKPPKL